MSSIYSLDIGINKLPPWNIHQKLLNLIGQCTLRPLSRRGHRRPLAAASLRAEPAHKTLKIVVFCLKYVVCCIVLRVSQ
jgi:hypothetical protein